MQSVIWYAYCKRSFSIFLHKLTWFTDQQSPTENNIKSKTTRTPVHFPEYPLQSKIHLGSTLQLANNKLGAHVLHVGIIGVREVLSIDALAVSGIADTIAVSTNVQSAGDPARRDGVGVSVVLEPIDVSGCGASGAVHVAGQAALVQGVADEEDALDGSVCRAGQLRQGVDGGGGTLGVALEDEAFVGTGLQSGLDVVDNVCGA